MRLALLGPPGSGKGTQARRICEACGLAHLASGDILRAEKTADTPRGRKLRAFVDHGLLVPDDFMVELMKSKILGLGKGFVLDGFPRTLPQAQALSRMLGEHAVPLKLVLNFVVDPAVLARRFAGRRLCPVCLTVYHLDSQPPRVPGLCDKEGATLVIREDDRPEVIQTRIATYQQTTAPLVAYYTQSGILQTVDTTGTIDQVANSVLDTIRRHFE